MDTVDKRKKEAWWANLERELAGRTPDYLIVQHMEPDHTGVIEEFVNKYPEAKIVATDKAARMFPLYYENVDFTDRVITVKENDTLSLGEHTLQFLMAPMVHWPEVMVTYDSKDKVVFSADAFGTFGETFEEGWDNEARRYFLNIVGKYGPFVQHLLKKASTVPIKMFCPLHGPVWRTNLEYYIDKHDKWSRYEPEDEGVFIAYTSVYGNTKKAAELLADKLTQKGVKVALNDLARCDMAEAVEDAFRYSKIVLATTTYNADNFPFMRTFIDHLTERNFSNREVAFIENGSWAPMATKTMKGMLEKCKNLTYAENTVKILSALNEESAAQLEALSDELCREYLAMQDDVVNKNDAKALFHIGYGLYVVTCNDGKKDNGLIVNTVTQLTDSPARVAVTINKKNYSHHVIKQTGKMNVNCLTTDAPFKVFEAFGFVSGRTVDKFADCTPNRSENGLVVLPRYINAFISLEVENYVDMDTHGMFICKVTEARVLSDKETMTYTYYQENVKPKPETEGKTGYVCKICGYVYEGEELPEDFVCPLCKHGPADFEKI